MLVVNSASPYRSLKDLLDAARAKPGELTHGRGRSGIDLPVRLHRDDAAAGVNMTYVPYPGSAPAVTAVLGQHVTSAFSGYAVVSEQIRATSCARSRSAPPSGSSR